MEKRKHETELCFLHFLFPKHILLFQFVCSFILMVYPSSLPSAFVDVDGRNVWTRARVGGSCYNNGFLAFDGQFPNPSGGDILDQKCFATVDVTVAHTAQNLTLEVYGNLDSTAADESWLFDDIRITLR